MSKKIAIIGAGIAGLTAGCYARMNGFEAVIFESHSRAGGLCTYWKRGDYTFDGCFDWLMGTGPGSDLYRFWKEVDAFDDTQVIDHEVFTRFEGKDGRQFSMYTDVDRLEKHLLDLSPEDAKQTKQLSKWLRKVSKFTPQMDKAIELFSLVDKLTFIMKMIPSLKDFNKLNKTTTREFAESYQDPLIRESIKQLFATGEYTLFGLVFPLGYLCLKSGGYVIGGSGELGRRIEKRFTDLGGKIHFNSKVDKILVESDKAVGIRLEDGSEYRSDFVISAADMHATLHSMLEGKYLDPDHVRLFKEETLSPSCVQVSLGVNMDMTNETECLMTTIPTSETLVVGDTKFDDIRFRNYAIDPTMAPKGKTVIVTRFHMNEYDHWKKLYAERSAYKQKKEEILQFTISQLEHRYPGITDKIEATDVCTPMTYQRYANTYNGTYMTWISTPKNSRKLMQIKKTVPGLDNFWMSGMWTFPPGGLPGGLVTSRHVIQIICKKEKQKFVTSLK
jgi:phytoene dehydrogenase-like protein